MNTRDARKDEARMERIRQRALKTRRAQGLPDKIEDPVVLSMIAEKLRSQGGR